MSVRISRRRAITVLAAAAGLPLLARAASDHPHILRWKGFSLGADAYIQLYHTDENKARAAVEEGLAELARMERMFSLFRPDSVISQLNKTGVVEDAPAEFIELVSYSKDIAERTGGWFEPTIQPLWNAYFQHFTSGSEDPAGPSAATIREALAQVGWRGIEIDPARGRVALAKPGMGLSLDSVGQGYITDRVTAILRRHGFQNMLVDMGELRAVAAKPDGSAWRVAIANPAEPKQAITEIDVIDQAVATSGGYGTIFDAAGNFTHLFDPFSGKTAPRLAGVTVIASSATRANAYSTPLSVVPRSRRAEMVAAAGGITAIFVTPDGVTETLKS
ncbi:FAD:protein FMN transferase [Telmatospirillum siberiense]|uniref:FAD:protein FMN transferase n=1 Tax=Telmatospirillum siberiense TaxID=382514 RepID=A0A2N3PMU4_9PROT|nr:FAD:protein FMN transferase [Telmatospirillum siberiense]PKU21717.1 FAD:protein FMN transferase [Telmatospirillum siberiense]